MEEIKLNEFGYSEMYEWNDVPESDMRLGRFVSFNPVNASKIELYNSTSNKPLVGITTINAITVSDNPNEWPGKYLMTDVGDLYLTNEVLSVGDRVYDENLEMSFIRTQKWEHLIKIQNPNYIAENEYVKRTNRTEWIRVSLLGKTLVKDNGECVPGEYCMPYNGKILKIWVLLFLLLKMQNISFMLLVGFRKMQF